MTVEERAGAPMRVSEASWGEPRWTHKTITVKPTPTDQMCPAPWPVSTKRH